MDVLTVFEDIPDLFVRVYDEEFQAWGRNFQKVGTRAVFTLRKPVEPSALSVDRRRIVGVILEAHLDGKRMVVRPLDDSAKETIARHIADLRREFLN